jgi:hypothetical protein
MATCLLTGTLIRPDGTPAEGARIYATPATTPTYITTSTGTEGLVCLHRWTISETDGTFSLALVRNVNYVVTIQELALIETVTIPDSTTVNLFSLIGGPSQGEATPGDENW